VSDLLASMDEHYAERLAIMQESGVPDAVVAADDDRHRCEVRSVLRRYYPRGQEAAAYIELVEKKRGKPAADRLRNDVRVAWRQRRIDEAGKA